MNLTAESVCLGHPDKLADQIADAVLDAALRQNPLARVACEVLLSFNNVCLAGEISGVELSYEHIVRQVIQEVGYVNWTPSFSCHLHEQSLNISQTVLEGGAGDQGIVYGYATNETIKGLPLALVQAHEIVRFLAQQKLSGPDGKAQVTTGDNRNAFVSVHTSCPEIEPYIRSGIADIVGHTNIRISFFEVGGPFADTGLTGRKLQVDTYGGAARHGGGAFSGKDPSKIDRTGAYLARAIALYLIHYQELPWAEVGLAYGFGIAEPLWVNINSPLGSSSTRLEKVVRNIFDLTPRGAITRFDLLKPIYQQTATYGHFGRPEFPWEK